MKKIGTYLIIICCMLQTTKMFAQSSFNGHAGFTLATDWLGWNNGTTIPLEIRTNNTGANARPIDLYTNNTHFLSVLTSGDLNIVQGTNGYKINNQYVLYEGNNANNIYVGSAAGNADTTFNNTFVGNAAGIKTGIGTPYIGNDNTFVGAISGNNNTKGNENSFYGHYSGTSNVNGNGTTYLRSRYWLRFS